MCNETALRSFLLRCRLNDLWVSVSFRRAFQSSETGVLRNIHAHRFRLDIEIMQAVSSLVILFLHMPVAI